MELTLQPITPQALVIDKVGFGATATGFETAVAPAPSNTTSIQRNATHTDTDNNSIDFTTGSTDRPLLQGR